MSQSSMLSSLTLKVQMSLHDVLNAAAPVPNDLKALAIEKRTSYETTRQRHDASNEQHDA